MHAFIFPGQGSQRPGMGEAWRDTESWSLVKRLSAVTGRDIERLLVDADAAELKVTGNAQLATFTLSLVILDAMRARADPPPAAVAGHSLGEYSALVAAGVLESSEGARLVAARGAAMESAAATHPGTMAAVLGLDPEGVAAACRGVDGAWVANDNAPGQIVIAGTAAGVEAAGLRARELGAKRVVPLPVGGAFHTPLMGPAQEGLDVALDDATLGDGSLACVANVDAEVHTAAGEWRRLLSTQLTAPVRWRQSLTRLSELGVTTFVELGPGTELSGMVKRTVDGAIRANVAEPDHVSALPGLD
ncbi:MAG: [acyl-carrier-protein] S-malonyltransferase [Acidimicrobiaceae bacterium]|jgi:[acyl-carrier-protein] S-malonyltransferase|nr:[acyl-carrier-protein] S-malonyltransferase [Acidimicrobiaceae bacterium]